MSRVPSNSMQSFSSPTAFPQPKDSFREDGRNNFFFANMCHVCQIFGEHVKLKRCSDCEMISYCSTEHQKKDWSSHRDFCRAICKIKKDRNLDHIFQTLKCTNTKADKSVSEIIIESGSRVEFKRILMTTLPSILKREIQPHEKEMIFFPRVCVVCFESNPELLRKCKKCPQASFCPEHLDDPSHREVCPEMLAAYMLQRSKGEVTDVIEVVRLLNVPFLHKAEELPSNMRLFIQTYILNSSKVKYEMESESHLMDALLSDKLSRPLSLLLGMKKLDLTSRSEIRVHIIGANMKELLSNDWESILHLVPKLLELRLIFIAPEVIVGIPGLETDNRICKYCKKKRKKVIIKVEKSMYESNVRKPDFQKPDVIVVYNSSFYAYKSWDHCLEILGKLDCPLMLTVHSQIEGYREQQKIASKFRSANCIFFQLNPYASLGYVRNLSDETIISRNRFMLLYKDFGTNET